MTEEFVVVDRQIRTVLRNGGTETVQSFKVEFRPASDTTDFPSMGMVLRDPNLYEKLAPGKSFRITLEV